MSFETPFGIAQVLRVGHPVEAFQRADHGLLRHHAEDARIEVPAEMRGDHVARSLRQLLHHGAGAGGVVFDVLAQFGEVGPGVVPAILGVHRVLVLQDVGEALEEGAAGAGVGGARVDEAVLVGAGPVQQLLRGLWRRFHRVRHVFQDRAGRAEHHADRLVLRQALHLQRAGEVDRLQVGQRGGVVGDDRDPQLLVDAGGQAVGAGENQIDIDVVRVLLRLDLAGQFRRRRLRERDMRHQLRVRLGVGLHRALRELQLAGDVDDVERDGRGRQGRGRGGPCAGDAGSERGKPRCAAQHVAAAGDHPAHGCFSRSLVFWAASGMTREAGGTLLCYR